MKGKIIRSRIRINAPIVRQYIRRIRSFAFIVRCSLIVHRSFAHRHKEKRHRNRCQITLTDGHNKSRRKPRKPAPAEPIRKRVQPLAPHFAVCCTPLFLCSVQELTNQARGGCTLLVFLKYQISQAVYNFA